MDMAAYPNIFSPLTIGAHTLANRVVMPSMGTNFAGTDGRVTQRMLAYYAARAAGGPGLLVAEAASVHPSGRVIERHFMNHDSSAVPSLCALAQTIKEHGVTTVLQLFHGGRNADPRLVGEPLAPSALRGPTSATTPRAMTRLEIEAMVDRFARAAERAMLAGFDGVEVHGAHEYLIHQFITPYCNRRNDDYGGSLQRRCRFAREVVAEVRQAIGPEGLLVFRLSGDDHVRGGITPEDAAEVAGILAEAGVDIFSVTGGVYETPHLVVPPLPSPPGTHLEAAVAVRRAVSKPVIAVGRFNSAVQVEAALDRVDLVGCGRAFLADPQWLIKSAQRREHLIRPCIGCNQGCIDPVLHGQPMGCVANPWLGREALAADPAPPDQVLDTVVVGGGLAGLQAAQTLGRLGHRVVLLEASARLGGQLRLAAVPPGKAEIARLADYHTTALSLLPNVEVRLGCKATMTLICQLKPQAVVVATGSEPALPALPGVEEAPVVSARQVLAGEVQTGRRVVVLGGGNLGSEVANHLAQKGKQVLIIELGLNIGEDLGPARRYLLRRQLTEQRVRRRVSSQVRRLHADRVSFLQTTPEGERHFNDLGPVDTFVAALGSTPRESLYLALEKKVSHILLVGDAMSPARMGEASLEGLRAALQFHRLSYEIASGRGSRPACAAAPADAISVDETW